MYTHALYNSCQYKLSYSGQWPYTEACKLYDYTVHLRAQLYTFAVLRDVLRKHVASVEMYSECDVSIAILFIQEGTAITTLI